MSEHRAESGFEGGGIAVNLGEEEPSLDGGEQGGGQSVGSAGRRRSPRRCVARRPARIEASHWSKLGAKSVRQSG